MLKKYECIFILESRNFEDAGKSFIEELGPFVEELGGEVIESQDMGHRQFAHQIKKSNSGLYWAVIINMENSKIDEFKERFKLNSSVIRLEIFNYASSPVPPKTAVSA